MTFSIVGIIGSGTMGSGIATSLASQGIKVQLLDQSTDIANKAIAGIAKFYDRTVEKARMTAEEAEVAKSRITAHEDLKDLSNCDLIIEAVFESFEVKAELLSRLKPHLSAKTVVATNTSCLRVSELAELMDDPSRFLGMHYFNPAAINPIVEVIKGDKTDDALYQSAIEFCKNTGKKPIACKDAYGFAINRFFVPYANEAVRMMDEGKGSTADIDAVARECLGVAAGPFLVSNLVKPRIMFNAQKNLAPHGAFYALADTLLSKGDVDYEFEIDGEGNAQCEYGAEIADRLRGAVFFPVLSALSEGVASAAEFDLGAKLALRFGKQPCALMDELGQEEVTRIVQPLLVQYGHEMPAAITKVNQLLA